MQHISVIGSGTMGNGIAHAFAQYGFLVSLVDIQREALDRALATIAHNLDRQVKKGAVDEAGKAAILSRIQPSTDLAQGVSQAALVVEAATESEGVKLDLFRELDRHCLPQAILASNTSSISITRIAAATNRPGQVIGMHFMNPVPVMKLVEVINGYSTAAETTNRVV